MGNGTATMKARIQNKRDTRQTKYNKCSTEGVYKHL